jgi:hypothetical protein
VNLEKLAEPFRPTDVEWRNGRSGKKGEQVWATCLAYITNRAIMDRLDAVVGPGNWRNEFKEWTTGSPGVMCGLSIRCEEIWAKHEGEPVTLVGMEWVTKWDGAEQTDIESVKGGFSNAMKRAAVLWGIGRYLYDLPEGHAAISDKGRHYQAKNEKKGLPAFKWDPPALPKWALPGAPDKEVA